MSDSTAFRASRRQALKLFSAPLLPLGGAALLTACGGGGSGGGFPIVGGAVTPAPAPVPGAAPAPAPAPAAANYVSATFTGMAAPTLATPAAMATTTVGSMLKIAYDDGSATDFKLAYQPFFVTGDLVPDGKGGTVLAGGYVDAYNQPIVDASVAGKERQFFSDSPDGTSLLALANPTVGGLKGKAVFAVVQFEYTTRDQAGNSTYGTLPSPIAVLTLDQDPTTGKLSLVKYHNVDMSSAHGLWITCGASLSPWNTHLSSEEYEPDAYTAATNTMFRAYSRNVFGSETVANPYHYGHLPEITVNPDGTGSVKKHYCMGRISHELIQVMPDMRTAIMGDDYTNGGFFMFVADKAKDLSAGTLYAARYDAGYSIDPAAAATKMSWIKLGHATSAEIEKLANTLKATDILDVVYAVQNGTADATPLTPVTPVDSSYTLMYCDGKANWVRVKAGMDKAAAFLETHRYANLKGASMAFTKMEGTTVNIKDKVAYSALQNIQDSMVSGGKGWTAGTNIALPKKLTAGGVMAHNLVGGLKDSDGAAIDSEWVPAQTRALIVGEDITADALGNTSNPDKIGNPDNLKFSEKMRTLFIGEDSSSHVNNFLWAYNVDTKALARVMSIPAGGESTGLHAVDELNGWTYIMSNFQHAGDWGSIHGKVQATLDPLVRANYKDRFGSAVGYLTADPVQPSLGTKKA
ncbi:PhoX family protein [Variovorax sp. PAMC 28711]|uniref:PhoX family protein n=1 Tax=Variovorax sp. PAMC 28711 TaxID=1795631 RepID=UPI00078D4E07|nr:alkaline phosphatase PhoX [Variovorax sp. PAMC 28711]AMM24877.1 alkaline phosphatase [Variovorax sp. PAMC 28711]